MVARSNVAVMVMSAAAMTRALVGSAIVVALVAGGWVYLGGRHDSASSAVLAVLQANPMAARSLAGAKLVIAEDRSAQSRDALTGKPRTSQVLRAFAPVGGGQLSALQQSLAERATRGGWVVSNAADGSVRGRATLAFGPATLVIAINRYLAPAAITVTLAPADPNL
jgi:hypothetical protein